jgi:hypothetical protein
MGHTGHNYCRHGMTELRGNGGRRGLDEEAWPPKSRCVRTPPPKQSLDGAPFRVWRVAQVSPLLRDLGSPRNHPSCRPPTNSHQQNIGVVDLDQSRLSAKIKAETAPAPLFGRIHQPTLERIAMHVTQFLNAFAFGPEVEVIEARLPDAAG